MDLAASEIQKTHYEENKPRLYRNVNYQEGSNNYPVDSNYQEVNGTYYQEDNRHLEEELEKTWKRTWQNPTYRDVSSVNL